MYVFVNIHIDGLERKDCILKKLCFEKIQLKKILKILPFFFRTPNNNYHILSNKIYTGLFLLLNLRRLLQLF